MESCVHFVESEKDTKMDAWICVFCFWKESLVSFRFMAYQPLLVIPFYVC